MTWKPSSRSVQDSLLAQVCWYGLLSFTMNIIGIQPISTSICNQNVITNIHSNAPQEESGNVYHHDSLLIWLNSVVLFQLHGTFSHDRELWISVCTVFVKSAWLMKSWVLVVVRSGLEYLIENTLVMWFLLCFPNFQGTGLDKINEFQNYWNSAKVARISEKLITMNPKWRVSGNGVSSWWHVEVDTRSAYFAICCFSLHSWK